jgi:quercetin dioxygenase-like cupin family protein
MSSRAYVLSPHEGETVIRSGAAANPSDGTPIPAGGSVCIKADPRTGSDGLSLGTQHLPTGIGIRVHRHNLSDEILFVLEGRGFVILDDARTAIGKGSAIFIPKGTWHGIENPDGSLELLWVVTPPGLEGLFREMGSAPGAPPKHLTLEQLNAIGRKHQQEFR